MGEDPTFDSLALSVGKLYYFDPKDITVEEGFNVRDMRVKANMEHLEHLTRLIAVEGITSPGRVRMGKDGKVTLVSGHTRLLAALANIANGIAVRFPAIIEGDTVSDLDRLYSLEVDNSGKQLEVLERATIVAKASELGQNNSQIAERMGVSGTYIGQLLALHAVPEKLKNMIRKETITATYVIELLRDNKRGRDGKDLDPATVGQMVLTLCEDFLAEAVANGEDDGKITKSKVAKASNDRREALAKAGAARKETAMFYKRSAVNSFVTFLIELSQNNTLGYTSRTGELVPMGANHSVRRAARSLLEATDVPIAEWLAEMRAADADEYS